MSAKTSTEKTSTEKAPGGKNVLVEFEDQIAWVTLNRPEKRNCMSPALNDEMVEVLDALEIDDRCGVLVLTGAGDSFSEPEWICASSAPPTECRSTSRCACAARPRIGSGGSS